MLSHSNRLVYPGSHILLGLDLLQFSSVGVPFQIYWVAPVELALYSEAPYKRVSPNGGSTWDIRGLWDISYTAVHVGDCGTWRDTSRLVGLGGTYQDLLDLVGRARTCGTWWDISGLGGTYQELRDLVGHTGTCGT